MEVGHVYRPPFPLINGHIETIYPALFRRVKLKGFQRERIKTPDNDFLDLDWLTRGADKLVIVSHGLEGNSQRAYMKGMAKVFYDAGYDALLWNYRGCSEEMNYQLQFYHSGATDDLDLVVKHAATKYRSIFMVGFSLGGNLTLKYLGEKPDTAVRGAAVFSVPLNLRTSCEKISEPANFLYANRFLVSLKKKIVTKSKLMKGLDTKDIDELFTLYDFDDRYTAPLHGFKDATAYYEACSAIHFLKEIRVPALIVNALNDPFLSSDCYPKDVSNPNVHLEFIERGGHVGFAQFNQNGLYWSEWRALNFAQQLFGR
ncbi:MAG TPA: alpha/beta fold hydrolase [Cyclobacteriaceae bacterium]|nr:alpha/beta fold hydrolase [Cyclobacteriaceae bacterium]